MATLTVDTRLPRDAGFSDVTIECHGTRFAAHKVVLCSQSPVIAACLQSHFKEGVLSQLTVNHFDVETVDRLLDVLYRGDYVFDEAAQEDVKSHMCERLDSSEPPTTVLVLHARMAMIADYYDVQGLKSVALERVDAYWQDNWNIDTFMNFLKECIRCDVADTLRGGLVPSAATHINDLVALPQFMSLELPSSFSLLLLVTSISQQNLKPNDITRAVAAFNTYQACDQCRSQTLILTQRL